jgi:hypothetical protein
MAYVLTVLNCLFSILYSYFPPRKNKQAQEDDWCKAGNRQLPEGAAFLAVEIDAPDLHHLIRNFT